MRSSSVATMTDDTERAADVRRYTCSIIGLPPISASALPGSLVDAKRAGMMAITAAEAAPREEPGLETGCTTNLTTTARHLTPSATRCMRSVVPWGRAPTSKPERRASEAEHDNPTGRDLRRPLL